MIVKGVQRRATYADVEAAPPNTVAEIIDGVLHVNPRPAVPHTVAASALGAEILPPFFRGRGGPGGWVILVGPELHLGSEPDVLVPDLAGWRRTRMPEIPEDKPYFTLAPDWVCEVLSPSTAATDRAGKLPIYAREGVGHAWLVDPLLKTLEVLRLDGATWRLVGTWRDEQIVHAEPFETFALELAALWVR